MTTATPASPPPAGAGPAPAVPYFDWDTRYRGWTDDVLAVVREVAESDEFILKSRVAELEARVAERTGAAHAVAVASGTGALSVILAALGVGPGDEVVTPAFSFISTASTVALRGARPVFADVDYDTACLDTAAAAAAVTARTRAILPAYLFTGHPAMGELATLARERGWRWSRTARSGSAPSWTAGPPGGTAPPGCTRSSPPSRWAGSATPA